MERKCCQNWSNSSWHGVTVEVTNKLYLTEFFISKNGKGKKRKKNDQKCLQTSNKMDNYVSWCFDALGVRFVSTFS